MAVKDVEEYYQIMLQQYVETKESLADFEEALKKKYITEDKLESVKEDVLKMQDNVTRLQYIMYLLALPESKTRRNKFEAANAELNNYFITRRADMQSIKMENDSLLTRIKDALSDVIS